MLELLRRVAEEVYFHADGHLELPADLWNEVCETVYSKGTEVTAPADMKDSSRSADEKPGSLGCSISTC